MSFLKKCSGGVPTSGGKNKEVTETKAGTAVEVGGPYDPPNKSSSSSKRNKKAKPDYDDSDLIATLKYSVESREERDKQTESDYDRMFLLSLLPEIKKVPENRKLSTNMEILSIIQRNQTAFSQDSNISLQHFSACTAVPTHQYRNTYDDYFQHRQNPNPATSVLVPMVQHWQNQNFATSTSVPIVQGSSQASVPMFSPGSEPSPPARTRSANSVQSVDWSSCDELFQPFP